MYFSTHFIYSDDEEDVSLDDDTVNQTEEVDDLIKDTDKENADMQEVLDLENIDNVSTVDDTTLENLDELDNLDDINNFNELDSLDDLDHDEDLDKKADENVFLSKKEQLMCDFIKNSIEDFYKNELYKSEFLHSAQIFDATKENNMAKNLNNYISNELFLECETKEIDLCEVINQISILEQETV